MTNYREILRLHSLILNKTKITASMSCSRSTVASVIRRDEACGLKYPLLSNLLDKQFAEMLFLAATAKPVYKMPDYTYVLRSYRRTTLR